MRGTRKLSNKSNREAMVAQQQQQAGAGTTDRAGDRAYRVFSAVFWSEARSRPRRNRKEPSSYLLLRFSYPSVRLHVGDFLPEILRLHLYR